MIQIQFLLALIVLFHNPAAQANSPQDLTPWLDHQSIVSKGKVLSAISPSDGRKGSIIASPSRDNPNYYFHWVRDAAIVIREVIHLYQSAPNDNEKKTLKKLLTEYIHFSRENQIASTLTGLGEPKFYVDGRGYDQAWGRPQNDGPALRALVLIELAEILLKDGENKFVTDNLYRPELPANSLIKADLEYVSHHWREPSFDLWEETLGDHFYTLQVQHEALMRGSWLASKLNDPGAADWYLKQGQALNRRIQDFFAGAFVAATLNHKGGMQSKVSNLDVAVTLGLLHAKKIPDLGKEGQQKVQKTMEKLEREFKKIFPVNHNSEKIGTAIGRYPEDVYDGHGFSGGNPWIITTLAFAEFYYELARYSASPSLASKWIAQGDQYLFRVKYHSPSDGAFAEQIDKHSGFMTGARDLTWSHAALLSAKRSREKAFQSLIK